MVEQLSHFEDLTLREQIEERVSQLSYPKILRLIALLLRSMGYREVRIVNGSKERGRSQYGGMSMIARSPGPLHSSLTLVQVKRINLQRRYVDELVGVMDGWGAGQGIIVTTGRIPEIARFCAERHPKRPIRLISSSQLAARLIEQGLGVRTAPLSAGSADNLRVDELFFEILTASQTER